MIDNRPYRNNVGIMIVESTMKVWLGKRIDLPSQFLQMPQGGIEKDETTTDAMHRELREEVGLHQSDVKILHRCKNWQYYDFPYDISLKLWKGSYKGQRQKWFLIQVLDVDSINIHTKNPEFLEGKWCSIDTVVASAVPFKRDVYRSVIKTFYPIVKKRSKSSLVTRPAP